MSDLISRSWLVEALESSGIADSEEDGWVHSFVMNMIADAPTVEERPCGEWEETEEAINEFAKWCYVNGIDFSYMAKATDTEPFVATVIKKYNADMRKKVE